LFYVLVLFQVLVLVWVWGVEAGPCKGAKAWMVHSQDVVLVVRGAHHPSLFQLLRLWPRGLDGFRFAGGVVGFASVGWLV
jgi:hypothetical protein